MCGTVPLKTDTLTGCETFRTRTGCNVFLKADLHVAESQMKTPFHGANSCLRKQNCSSSILCHCRAALEGDTGFIMCWTTTWDLLCVMLYTSYYVMRRRMQKTNLGRICNRQFFEIYKFVLFSLRNRQNDKKTTCFFQFAPCRFFLKCFFLLSDA